MLNDTGYGKLIVISAPSGAGKTSLVNALIQKVSGLVVSVSHTTRPQRPGENNGEHYYFISEKEFSDQIKKNYFLEHASVFNHFYGTSRAFVETALARGNDVVLEIDWQGAAQIRNSFSNFYSIFILPPSVDALSDRLIGRNQDSDEVIAKRLSDAKKDMQHACEYDYLIFNDFFEHAVELLKTIILAERLKTPRQSLKHKMQLESLTR